MKGKIICEVVYKTTDGKQFITEEDAINHQKYIEFDLLISDLMDKQGYTKYKNEVLTFLTFHAREIVEAYLNVYFEKSIKCQEDI